MPYTGEILALVVAVLWTFSSLCCEVAAKKEGSVVLNVVRLTIATVAIGIGLWIATGSPLPTYADKRVWGWLALSSLAGYIIGDYFFLKSFILIGARFGELFMTIAPVAAAFTGWVLLGETMSGKAIAGMFITIAGICLSIMAPKEGKHLPVVKLPWKGVVYGLIAGVGQGVGLVFSKQGMLLYQQLIPETETAMRALMPFSATLIRCIVGLVGFVAMLFLMRETGRFKEALHTRRFMAAASLSAIAGPVIGVALSLMATLYTTTGATQTIMALVPILILWPSKVFLNATITQQEIIGACIAVAGITLLF